MKIYTLGYFLSNNDKRVVNPIKYLSHLRNLGVRTIVSVVPIRSVNPEGARPNFREMVKSLHMSYICRGKETFQILEAAKLKDENVSYMEYCESNLFQPLLEFIKGIDNSEGKVGIEFPTFNTLTDGVATNKPSLHGKFCYYVYKNNKINNRYNSKYIDLNHLFINYSPEQIRINEVSNQELFVLGKGSSGMMNNIREIDRKRRSNRKYDIEVEDEIENFGMEEWRRMNDESGGAASWNID